MRTCLSHTSCACVCGVLSMFAACSPPWLSRSDLLVSTAANTNLLLRRDADGRYRLADSQTDFPTQAGGTLFQAQPALVLDMDQDGDQDVYLPSGSVTKDNTNNDMNVARALHVVVLTASGSFPAYGAVVTVTAVTSAASSTPWVFAKVVGASSGLAAADPTVVVGLPRGALTFNVTVQWGPQHPPTSSTSHPLLYGFQPTGRVYKLVVRPEPPLLSVGWVLPWATGSSDTLPVPNDPVRIPLVCAPCALADHSVVSATVNGMDVASSFGVAHDATNRATNALTYDVTYLTADDDVFWPWDGLHMHVVLQDSAGLRVALHVPASSPLIVGTKPRDVASELGLSLLGASCVCVADVNQDGAQDVFLGFGANVPNALLLNTGDGSAFTDAASTWNVAASDRWSVACAAADLDDSGFPWLVITVAENQPLMLFRNVGGTHFLQEATPRGVTATGNLRDVVAADLVRRRAGAVFPCSEAFFVLFCC